MADEQLSSWAKPKWFEDYERNKVELKGMIDQFLELQRVTKGLEINLKGASTLKETTTSSEALANANKQLAGSYAEIAKSVEFFSSWKARSNGSTDSEIEGTKKVIRLKQEEEKARLATIRADQAAEKQSKDSAAAADTQNKITKQLTNEYGLLSKAHQEAALKAKNYALTLGSSHPITQQAIVDANAMDAKLKSLDSTLGDNRRNVGNYASGYNGLGNAIQQVGRELPNFALSFRTGISAISNNLPILQDEIRKVRTENALLQAEGKPTTSVFKQIASSIFSWQTALIAGITLLIAYGDDIKDFVANLFGANASIRQLSKDFNEAFEKNAKSAADEVATLNLLVVTLQSTNSTRKEVFDAIEKIKSSYPEYLSFLTEENRLSKEVGESALQQVDLLRQRAIATSYADAYKKSLERVTEQENLAKKAAEGSFGFWKSTGEFLKGNIDERDRALTIMRQRINAMNSAINDSEIAFNAAKNPLDAYTLAVKESIAKEQAHIEKLQSKIAYFKGAEYANASYVAEYKREISQTQKAIDIQNEYIKNLEKIFSLKRPTEPEYRITQAEISQKGIEAQMLLQKKGSKAERDLAIENEIAKSQVAINTLRNRYITEHKIKAEDLKNNQSYLAELALQEAQSQRTVQNIKDDFEKQHKPKQKNAKIPNDYSSEVIAAQRSAIEEQSKNRAAGLKDDEAAFKAVADDESKSLADRLLAYSQYLQVKKALVREEKDTQIAEVKNTIKLLNDEIAKDDSLIAGGKLSPTQKTSLQNKNKAIKEQITALNDSIIRLTTERVTEQNTIESQGQKEIQTISKNAISKRIKDLSDGLQSISDNVSENFRAQKDALQQQYEAAKITYAVYRSEFAKIQAKEDNETLAKQKAFTKEALTNLLKDANAPAEVIAAVRKKLDELYDKSSSNAKSKSILGFSDEIVKQIKTATQLATTALEDYQKLSQAFSQKRLDSLQAEIDAIEKKKQTDIDGINASFLSESDKAKKIADINAKAQDEENKRNDAIKKEKRKQAEIEKSINLARAIIQGALFVLESTSIPEAIARGLLTAAEIGTIIATPIPSYEEGTKGKAHPGGKARMFEGNKPELVIEKSGKTWIGKKDGIYDLAAGSHVISNEELMRIASMYSFNVPIPMLQRQESGTDARVIKQGLDQVREAIQNMPRGSVNITGRGITDFVEAGQGTTIFIHNLLQ